MMVIRGATFAQNTAESIGSVAIELMSEIMTANGLEAADVKAVFFSVTADLNAANPATAVRKHFSMRDVAFMCFGEMAVVGGASGCLRAAVFAEKDGTPVHRYINGAEALRPDLS